MIVSWTWLKRYLNLEMPAEELCDRFSLSGLNHESTESIYGDLAIDLEVTSNRPDCLGHIGIAREASVLYNLPLEVPNPQPKAEGPAVQNLASVDVQAPELCSRFTARLIKGVKVGPSPDWLVELLRNRSGDPDSFKSVNNIADITNFVMMECGQPLHAFDFDKLQDGKIVVREAKAGETLEAIDHKDYPLQPGMCVIADATKPVGLAGIMGGASTEITEDTVSVLIEAAEFSPMSIRDTSRKLKLASDASYRFERTVDPAGVDWASRRCCQLIMELAGGTLCEGVIDVGQAPEPREPLVLRFQQIQRILGIEIPRDSVSQILISLGLEIQSSDDNQLTLIPPSWRRDLSREIDLIEEVARIHGYDHIPEDRPVPMAVSSMPIADLACGRIRHSLTACGLNEALSPTLVPPELSDLYSPWTDLPAMITSQPMSGVLDTKFWNAAGPVHCVRRSLVPSLVELRRLNEFRHSDPVELFEIAKVYLPQTKGFPNEPMMVGICSGRDLLSVKSIVQTMVDGLNHDLTITVKTIKDPFFAAGRGLELLLDGTVVGLLGEISKKTMKQLKLKRSFVVGEIQLDPLVKQTQVIPQAKRQSPYPPIERDLNFIVDSSVRWAALESAVRTAGGPLLETVSYRETFVDEKRDGAGKKRVLLAVSLRSESGTLTGQQADEVCQAIVDQCDKEQSAKLVTG